MSEVASSVFFNPGKMVMDGHDVRYLKHDSPRGSVPLELLNGWVLTQ